MITVIRRVSLVIVIDVTNSTSFLSNVKSSFCRLPLEDIAQNGIAVLIISATI